ncbi:hypothetical protein HCN44_008891 [Aphidius gifuensis]|uniref:Nucleolar protein of 40 kDa n=1 Tax=Aphidius gifuensis TaxID=684658 RepID=A0A835CSR1_APHGI|nr:nucleolar protein of 40 kDa-like [Aphidius gifuensis]KAF7991520.1 hypothetical protein HCN44_008891 [Aphidius gifuensis]
MTSCKLNEIFLGEVSSVQNYGAFVKIPGCRQQGLIHKSQVSSARVDDVCEILQRGERVWCKIVNIDDDGKIGLSMKLVNQGNGIDLDPNGVEWHRNEQKKKSKTFGDKQERKVIELQAVLNTTCTQCGTKGHLSKDCFVTPDGKKYELLSDIEDDNDNDNISTVPKISDEKKKKIHEKSSKSKKKLKKHKKSKKSKKSKHQTDESSSDDDDDDDDSFSDQQNKNNNKKKKKKKHSKEVKKRKRKYESESSSSDSAAAAADNNNIVKEKHSKKCKHSRSKYSD